MNDSVQTEALVQDSDIQNLNYADIVIVGGGVVGATTAILLAKSLLKLAKQDKTPQIYLIDAGSANKAVNPAKHDNRVFALNPASIRLLKHAGVWQKITRKADYTGMHVWATNGVGDIRFDSAKLNLAKAELSKVSLPTENDILGSMVEPSVIQQALAEMLKQFDNITWLADTKVADIDNISESYLAKQLSQHLTEQTSHKHASPKWLLKLKHSDNDKNKESSVSTPLVIACDGRGSFIRQSLGIAVDTLDYKKTAITCAIQTEKSHQAIARQIFLPTGPLAILPLANLDDAEKSAVDLVSPQVNHYGQTNDTVRSDSYWQSIVWTLPAKDAQDLLAQPHGYLASQLASASQYELGNVLQIESVASFPLSALHAKTYVQEGLALVGDAAHGVHPLAGQGLNLGMLDVAVLTDLILTEIERSYRVDEANMFIAIPLLTTALAKYQQKRRPHNTMMMHAFSLIGWGFAQQNYPAGNIVEWLRSEAINVGNKLPFVNNLFNHKASGLAELEQTRW